ncbi:ABC transporter ATP-binding protein [Metamycoplasma arthritidis]|uniref:Sugar ABC transporter ATP-binding protein n=1 Tax=Metamycoplasma arthritidis (strain 158L3-1) TaxID=243272 RepID=B3PNE7_META1|nr:ABC transporter ATP-binding protein [Metamycoplasma arthritidis]ACF07549.1 sugar ABC transporter ATP-binding protein [Metamycoplasma arthritidis 158L3-1]
MNAVEFVNVTKEFPGIKANDNVSFEVKKGSIHALIGENGAGKSTLMSVLFGLYEPTSGKILVNENQVFFRGTNDANALGIGMVHQHFKLVDVYTNLDNIILGSEPTKTGILLDRNVAIRKIRALQNTYDLHFDLFQKSGEATVSTQQKVEIMKMLYKDNDILVFDEPTAALTDEEIQGLLRSFEIFRKNGKTIIFISHKLKEIEQVADYATVLRLGKVVGNFDMKKVEMKQIVEAMVGSTVKSIANTTPAERKEVVFELRNISTNKGHKKLSNVSLKIHAGEIFAIAGVEGNGQNTLEQVCSGMIKPSFGNIFLRTQNPKDKTYSLEDVTNLGAYGRSKKRLSFIPADRHHHGLILDYSITDNAILRRLWDPHFQVAGIIKNKAKRKFATDIIEKYDVRGARGGNSISRSLSGGNQQKFIVGREIETPHDFIIIVQPTRGLDIGAINNIHSEILKEKADGKAILLISYELDEVIALADTIAVINEGHIVAINDARKITRTEIGSWMAASTSGGEIRWWETNSEKESKKQYFDMHTKSLKADFQSVILSIASTKSSISLAKKMHNSSEVEELKMQLLKLKAQESELKMAIKQKISSLEMNFAKEYAERKGQEHAN